MLSTYSVSSVTGLVSSNRRFVYPPYFFDNPKFRQMLLACPICRYPLGSGGNLVTIDLYLPALRSSSMISSKKLRLFSSFMRLIFPPAKVRNAPYFRLTQIDYDLGSR